MFYFFILSPSQDTKYSSQNKTDKSDHIKKIPLYPFYIFNRSPVNKIYAWGARG